MRFTVSSLAINFLKINSALFLLKENTEHVGFYYLTFSKRFHSYAI